MQCGLRPRPERHRSIGGVRRPPVLLAALLIVASALTGAAPAAASEVLVLDRHGDVHVRADRHLPATPEPPAPPPGAVASAAAAPARAADAPRTLLAALARLERAGALPADRAAAYAASYRDAARLARRLKGTRRSELRAVLANANAMARDGLITGSRAKVVLETVRRNAQWWGANAPLAYGRRIRFPGSRLVWQSYPGQGVQIQWLGTFGRMNQLFLAKDHPTAFAAMAREVVAFAVDRAGGIAWEYQFRFGGGRPPWVSGLAQGTGIQALSRAAVRLREPQWFSVARRALGVFRTPPPSGVRVVTPAGAHYLAYSYAPGQRIYNAFFQSLIGLHDFATFANDPLGRRLWLQGERQARVEVRRSNSGTWSWYQPGVPSDLGYHRVLRDFVTGLCDRLNRDRQREAIELRERTGNPGAVLRSLDRWPDSGPYCQSAQTMNRQLWKRLRALGLPTPFG